MNKTIELDIRFDYNRDGELECTVDDVGARKEMEKATMRALTRFYAALTSRQQAISERMTMQGCSTDELVEETGLSREVVRAEKRRIEMLCAEFGV